MGIQNILGLFTELLDAFMGIANTSPWSGRDIFGTFLQIVSWVVHLYEVSPGQSTDTRKSTSPLDTLAPQISLLETTSKATNASAFHAVTASIGVSGMTLTPFGVNAPAISSHQRASRSTAWSSSPLINPKE